MNEPRHWSKLPAEVDLYLDGEMAPAERVVRAAEAAADPEVARRVESRRALHRAIERAREPLPEEVRAVAALEHRVRASLADSGRRAGSPRRAALALGTGATAILAAGVVLGLLASRPQDADAMPTAARLAADLVRGDARVGGPVGTCESQPATSPFRLPLVAEREMAVKGCIESPGGPQRALLYRIEDLEVVGYVAVPSPGAAPGPEIGVTRLEDVVVFDVRLAGGMGYLAIQRDAVDRRGTCAACHGPTRAGAANPHLLKERRLPSAR